MSNTKILPRVFTAQDPTRGVCVHAYLPPLWPFSCFLQGSGLMASSLAFSGERVCFLTPDMQLHNGSLGQPLSSLTLGLYNPVPLRGLPALQAGRLRSAVAQGSATGTGTPGPSFPDSTSCGAVCRPRRAFMLRRFGAVSHT